MRRERQVDTSTLRSTKLLGQRQRTKLERRTQRPRSSDNEDELSANSAAEDDRYDTIQKDSNEIAKLESTANHTPVGAALKSGAGNHGPARAKQKEQNKVTWRERLEYNRIYIDKSESNLSDSDTSTSTDGEYSDWSGFTSEGPGAISAGYGNSVDPDASASGEEHAPFTTQQNEAADQIESLDDGEESLHQRASQFKLWARQQSGLDISESNISSLPLLPSIESKAKITTSAKSRSDGIETTSNGLEPRRVTVHSVGIANRRHISSESIENHPYKSLDYHCQLSLKSSKSWKC